MQNQSNWPQSIDYNSRDARNMFSSNTKSKKAPKKPQPNAIQNQLKPKLRRQHQIPWFRDPKQQPKSNIENENTHPMNPPNVNIDNLLLY